MKNLREPRRPITVKQLSTQLNLISKWT